MLRLLKPLNPFAEQSNERPGVTLPERSMREPKQAKEWVAPEWV